MEIIGWVGTALEITAYHPSLTHERAQNAQSLGKIVCDFRASLWHSHIQKNRQVQLPSVPNLWGNLRNPGAEVHIFQEVILLLRGRICLSKCNAVGTLIALMSVELGQIELLHHQ